MSRLDTLLTRTALGAVLAALASPALAQPSAPFATQTSNGTTPSYVVSGTTGVVGLTAPRTIIDWRDFTVNTGETLTFNFQARSDIVLNRLDFAQARIDGTLNSFVGSVVGGNVWISASNGVIFGPNAQVNVGGLLATTATLTNPTGFLNPATTQFGFAFTGTGFPSGTAYPTGSGYGGVSVQAGARLQTNGGLLALIAPFVSVASGAAVGGGTTGDVLVGGANAFTVSLQTETAGDLDMLEFVIDTPSDVSTPIAIQGSLAGRNVYVATLAPSTLMNAVIVDTGPVAATRASNGAGGVIVLSSGADTITPNAQPTLSTGATAAIAPVTFGNLAADSHAYVYASGDLTQQAGSTLTGGAVTIGVGGNASLQTVNLTGPFAFAPIPGAVVPQFTAAGPITAGSVSVVRAGAVTVGDVTATTGDVTLQSLETTGQGYAAVTAGAVRAQGSADLEGRNVTVASVTAVTGGATVRAVTPRTARGPAVFADAGSLSALGPSIVQAQQGYASVGSVAFTDPSGAGALTVSAPQGRVYVGYAPGGADGGADSGTVTGAGHLTLTARDAVAMDVQGPATVDLATSQLGSVTLTSDTLAAGQVTAAVDATLTARAGALSTNQVTATGAVSLAAPAGTIQAGSLSGDSVTVAASGAARIDDAATSSTLDGRVRVSGSSVSITTADAASDLVATATGGPAAVGNVTAGGDVTISATAGAASLRSAAFTDGGFTYDPSATPGVLRMTAAGAGGDVSLGLTGGFVTGAAGIDLEAARDVTVAVTGPIRITSVTAGRAAILSTTDSPTLGAGTLTVDEVTATGDITATASGALVLSDVMPGASLSATGASLTLGTLRNPPPVDLTLVSTASGFSRATPISAGRGVTITAAGPLTLSDVTAGTGGVVLSGAGVEAGRVSAATSATITATGGGITLTSAQVSSGAAPITLAADGPIRADTLQAGGTVTATTTAGEAGGGSSIDVRSLTAGAATLSAGDGYVSVTTAAIAPGGLLDVRAAGPAGFIFLGYAPGGARTGGGSGTLSGAAALRADLDVDVNLAGDVRLGDVSAGRDVSVTAGGALAAGDLDAARDLSLQSGDALTTGDLSAGGTATAVAGGALHTGDLAAGQDASAVAGGALQVGDVVAPTTQLRGASVVAGAIQAATAATLTADTGDVSATSVQTGALTASAPGGALSLPLIRAQSGALTGATITLGDARFDADATLRSAGDLAATTLQADDGLDVRAGVATSGAAAAPDASVTLGAAAAGGALTIAAPGSVMVASLTSGGAAQVTGGADVSLGTAAAGAALTITAPGSVTVASLAVGGATQVSGGVDVSLGVASTAGAGAVSAGRDLSISGLGAVNLGAATLTAGRDATLSAGALFSIGSLQAARSARIVAGDLALNGALTSPSVAIESAGGTMTVGDGVSGGGLALSAAEFGRIRASGSLSLYAGPTTGTLRGDLTVGDLAVDPVAVHDLALYAAAGHFVSVTGALAPTATGGTLMVGGTAASGWRPSSILVSGSLGAATYVSETQFTGVRAFDQVALNATGDVLIGSPRFIAAVQGTPAAAVDIAANRPGGLAATGIEVGRVQVVAGALSLATDGKVLQQNTSGSPFTYSGTYLIGSASSPGAVLTIDPPSVVDLFGTYLGGDGRVATGRLAARGAELRVVQRTAGAAFRFNGCEIGSFAACTVSEVVGPEQGLQLLDEQQAAVLAAVTTRQQELTESALLDDDPEAQVEDQLDPVVTGAGNEEIWRTRRKGSQ